MREELEPRALHELDRAEMWDAARALNPDITEEQFDRDWQEFVALKAAKKAH